LACSRRDFQRVHEGGHDLDKLSEMLRQEEKNTPSRSRAFQSAEGQTIVGASTKPTRASKSFRFQDLEFAKRASGAAFFMSRTRRATASHRVQRRVALRRTRGLGYSSWSRNRIHTRGTQNTNTWGSSPSSLRYSNGPAGPGRGTRSNARRNSSPVGRCLLGHADTRGLLLAGALDYNVVERAACFRFRRKLIRLLAI
jgi:hypothetical protein